MTHPYELPPGPERVAELQRRGWNFSLDDLSEEQRAEFGLPSLAGPSAPPPAQPDERVISLGERLKDAAR